MLVMVYVGFCVIRHFVVETQISIADWNRLLWYLFQVINTRYLSALEVPDAVVTMIMPDTQ